MGDILGGKRVISIHAPREGSDLAACLIYASA